MLNVPPVALIIAATDSSSGAGGTADLATLAHFGVHGCLVISQVTAQNPSGIIASHTIPPPMFREQLLAVQTAFAPQIIKLSVIAEKPQLNSLIDFFAKFKSVVIYDPVFKSSSDDILTDSDLKSSICQDLLPHITLITPNIPEAEFLTDMEIHSYSDMVEAGKQLLQFGVANVLLKGGHLFEKLEINAYSVDLFLSCSHSFWLISKRQYVKEHVHGTGCHLASAITANLALGAEFYDAIVIAKEYLNAAIRNSYLLGNSVQQLFIPPYHFETIPEDFPTVTTDINELEMLHNNAFPPTENMNLYPIVDSSILVEKLARLSVKTIQLRIKHMDMQSLEDEIVTSIKIANHYQIRLFINDYWEMAIKHKAYGVHLGQEDLATANIQDIWANKLHLGISTHNYYELARALFYQPSYIALGPIYPTKTKNTHYKEQGIDKLIEWKQLSPYPLVAIGGINLANTDAVLSVGINNIAVVSAITQAIDIDYVACAFMNKIDKFVKLSELMLLEQVNYP